MSCGCESVLEAPPSPVATGGKKTTPPGSGSGGSAVSPGVEKCATATKKSGGLTGIVLDVTYEVDCSDCDSLQAIQVVWAKGPIKVGDTTSKLGGTDYDAFVDGGKNSPYVKLSGNPPAHPTKPYYMTASEVSSGVTYSGGKGTVRIQDNPAAVHSFSEVYFETAVMCVNYKKSGKDKVLKVFRWGWSGTGTKFQTRPGETPAAADIQEYDDVSPEFKAVVAHDYPDYDFAN